MGFRLADEYVEALLADKDASDANRDVITKRADLARAWMAACFDAKNGRIEWSDRPPWRRVDR